MNLQGQTLYSYHNSNYAWPHGTVRAVWVTCERQAVRSLWSVCGYECARLFLWLLGLRREAPFAAIEKTFAALSGGSFFSYSRSISKGGQERNKTRPLVHHPSFGLEVRYAIYLFPTLPHISLRSSYRRSTGHRPNMQSGVSASGPSEQRFWISWNEIKWEILYLLYLICSPA